MAILNADDVKAGKVTPQVGDSVSGYQYVGGNPTSNNSYTPLTGNDYLASIPADRANVARGVLAGHLPYPSTNARNNTYNQQTLQDVLATEPDYDATAYKRRQDMVKDFTSGKTSSLVRALNMAPQHAVTLANSYDMLHNFDGPQTVNSVLTNVEAALPGSTGNAQRAARGAFNAVQPAVADELATLYKGGPGTVPGIEDQKNAFPMGAGPSESGSALKTAAELMHDRLLTLQEQWRNGMGTAANMFPVISPKAAQALQTLWKKYDVDGSDIDLPSLTGPQKNPAVDRPAPAAAAPKSLPQIKAPTIIRYDGHGNRIQ